MHSAFVTSQPTRLQPSEVQPSQLLQPATVKLFHFPAPLRSHQVGHGGLIIDLLPRIALVQWLIELDESPPVASRMTGIERPQTSLTGSLQKHCRCKVDAPASAAFTCCIVRISQHCLPLRWRRDDLHWLRSRLAAAGRAESLIKSFQC